MRTAKEVTAHLLTLLDDRRAAASARFFKTGPGQYGEGDKFIGLPVPESRRLLRSLDLPLKEQEKLLQNEWHEARLLALMHMVRDFDDAPKATCESYLRHTRWINNWDLVDSSAQYIVGAHLHAKSKAPLNDLARSKSLWERRIAIIATFYFIQQGEPEETLRLAKVLLHDEQDLMHKAVGWMLREVGKRCSESALTGFLDAHAKEMPRTMLRYALERLSDKQRKHYMARG